jgi:hypothetical protein
MEESIKQLKQERLQARRAMLLQILARTDRKRDRNSAELCIKAIDRELWPVPQVPVASRACWLKSQFKSQF